MSLGWAAWLDFWSAKTYAMQRLQRSANQLRAPFLTRAFVFWLRDWQQETSALALQQAAAQMSALAEQLAGAGGRRKE